MHKLPKGGGTKIINMQAKPMHKLRKGGGTKLINIQRRMHKHKLRKGGGTKSYKHTSQCINY